MIDEKVLIERLEEYTFPINTEELYYDKAVGMYELLKIVKQLAEEHKHDKVYQTAIMYAENIHRYGIAIDSIWETATQNAMALNQAYMRGRQDERDRFAEWQDEHNNGWIPCSERLPDVTAYYYVTSLFKGEPKRYTAKFEKGRNRWSLPGEPYYDVPVLAWYPLPTPYQPKGE